MPTVSTAPGGPIAVVGAGLRFPGGIRDLAGLEQVLGSGRSLIGPVPPDRWGADFHDPEGRRPGTSAGHVGTFLEDVRRFDAEHFGLSPREAREMDPQQRLLLEVAAETLETDGRSGQQWAGSRTGVFTGVLASDYLLLHGRTRGVEGIDPFYATGKEFSFGAGRVAYSFDLRGPVLTVTTACSSSLLAVHLAAQSLRAGECDAALAGGVNLLLAPDLTVFMSRVGALSGTGRSLPFSSEADGVVRGEGCALILLKRLADAERDGDEVLAVLDGSAVNHDGHSAGLTVPSAEAQVQLLQQALAQAGLSPDEVGYVEAHATGTPLGDPIELAALAEVYQRRENPGQPGLLVGSHKAVFGHLDSAAGILGLLKALLVVRGGVVPAQPPLAGLTTGFDWASADLRVAREQTSLPEAPRHVGVSAFGLSGTNVHVILGQSPITTPMRDAGHGDAVRPRTWGGGSHWLAGVEPGQQRIGEAPEEEPAEQAAEPELRPAAGPAPERVRELVAEQVRAVLGLDAGDSLPGDRSLLEMGLNSVTAVELANALAGAFGTPVDDTLVYQCPTTDALVAQFAPTVTVPVPAEKTTAPVRSGHHRTDLAIVGMACRVPGADDLAEFWRLVSRGEPQIGELSQPRADRDGWAGLGPEVPRRGGFLDRIEGFDAGYFRISPLEAARMDPQQRLFLEVATEAVADAGIPAGSAAAHRTGVYVGMDTTDYQQRLTRDQADVDIYFGTGNSFSGTPGRLAFCLDLGGPSLAVDTACSSSLTAVHLAGQALRAGDCDAAVVGGVNVISSPTVSVSMARGGALAADGRCKTFSESADGYGRGEGAGALVLRRLDDAVADGDRIYATILGSAINTDGASGGLTVPDPSAQTRVVRAALEAAGLQGPEVGYVEAHGTGTALGDPIELKALDRALHADRRGARTTPVGSVKSLVGHLEAAAGVIGLIKAGLAIGHAQIPPHVAHGRPTQRVDWDSLGLELAGAGGDWEGERIAGVSAFGFTGSNAHVLLGAAPAGPSPEPVPGPFALPISAATKTALRSVAARLAARLADPIRLDDLSFTLAHRRTVLACRAVVIAADAATARAALEAIAADREHPAVVTTGSSVPDDLPEGSAPRYLQAVAHVLGQPVAWEGAAPATGNVLPLPGYPWERRDYWFGTSSPAPKPLPKSPSQPAASPIEPTKNLPSADTEHLLDLVIDCTAAVLEMDPDDLEPQTGFFDLGMDSITSQALKTRLEAGTGTELPATVVFELPTPRRVADYLSVLLAEESGNENPDSSTEPTDEELLSMLTEATSSARELLREEPTW